MPNKYRVTNFFLDLVKFNTQADTKGLTSPTLKRFAKCAKYIISNLRELGIKDVYVSKEAYVYATIPASPLQGLAFKGYTIAFLAHYDTALENSGKDVKPIVHKNYQRGNIKLPKNNIIITSDELKDKKGHDIITSSGDTLLGADDKAGVAILLDFARFLMKNPKYPRPNIILVFNNNEEVGRGVDYLDYDRLGADYAYCVDGGEVGNIFKENFNAEGVKIEIIGKTVHPGYAKNKMVNAVYVANDIVNHLRKKFRAPENSEKRQPYLGISEINGSWTRCTISCLLRSFDQKDINLMQNTITKYAVIYSNTYKDVQINISLDNHHSYKNSADILQENPVVNRLAVRAYKKVGVKPIHELTRGGFDGVKMSFNGLPTTNIFNGGMNFHGLNEWVTIQDLELSVKMITELSKLWASQIKNDEKA